MFAAPLNKKQETNLFIVLLALALTALVCAVVIKAGHIVIASSVPHCVFLTYTGFYCPGCGCSHAVDSLLSFRFAESFLYQPFILYVVTVALWYLISHAVEYLSRGRAAIGMRYRDVWVYAGVAVIIINWIVRNILLKCCGITIY